MELDVKPQEIGPEHAIKQLARPRANPKRFGVGPWDVPKERHLDIRAFGLNEPR